MRGKFTEDLEIVQIENVWETWKGTHLESEFHLCLGSSIFIEDGGLVYMFFQESRNLSKQV